MRSDCWASAPSQTFVNALRERGVDRVSVGRSIVATWEPHENTVLRTIRDFGLELQVIFNKGAVMILPAGVNKATGLRAALEELNLSAHNAVGVGDAENDHAFLSICECSAAVANALPAVKDKADIVLQGDHGAGVTQLIEEMLADDLASREPALWRHTVNLGVDDRGEPVRLSPYGVSALIVGTSGGGKSTVAVGLIERLQAKGYSFCVIDPEGDYDNLEGAAVLGGPEHAPTVDECIHLLGKPDESAVINLVGLKLNDRPGFFMSLFAQIRDLRAKTGRPHWLVVDEAHHVMPAHWQPTQTALPQRLNGVLMISVTPSLIAEAALRGLDTLIVLGEKPREMLREFADANRIAVEAPCEKAGGRQGARLEQDFRSAAGAGRARTEQDGTSQTPAQVRGRFAAGRSQLLFPRTSGKTETARAQPDPLHGSRRRRRRRNLAISPAQGGRLRVAAARDQGRGARPPGRARSSATAPWTLRFRAGKFAR